MDTSFSVSKESQNAMHLLLKWTKLVLRTCRSSSVLQTACGTRISVDAILLLISHCHGEYGV